uniref:Uncharacterized protein n=1 Tax=Anguilla anguilla TaxID=7936 RepID=A0A0E9T5H1_ANGAN
MLAFGHNHVPSTAVCTIRMWLHFRSINVNRQHNEDSLTNSLPFQSLIC